MKHPRVIAIIPARGGSKGVPGKNLRRVGGRSLVERAIDACRAAQLVEEVYVSTDHAEIAASAEGAGAEVIMRPAELSNDTASSEAALLHALDQLIMVKEEPEVLVFVQCTSPFIAPDDLDRGIELVVHNQADSVFSGVATYEFLWRAGGRFGLVTGQNHDPAIRPRRQDREPDFSRADGLGVERLRSVGIPLLIVSKEINPVVQARAAKLRVEVLQSIEDKRPVVRDWLAAHGIPANRAAYLGNDVNDLGPMGLVGWPVAVADAHPAVRQAARLVLARPGGHGAVRELCDLVIEHRARAGHPAAHAGSGDQKSFAVPAHMVAYEPSISRNRLHS